jgi:uncharacterized protein (TIGR02453 family)
MSKLHPQTLKFLSTLKKNNNKAWFDKNKPQYEEIKNELISVADEVIREVNKFDSSLGNVDPKKCVFRIYRDIRFSPDKTPYKTNIGFWMSKGGMKNPSAGYYVHLQPGKSFLGGGIWMPDAEALNKIRQEIDYNFGNFKKIVESLSFKKLFGKLDTEMKLSRPPKNYDENNPAIEYLKLKSFTAGAELTDTQVMAPGFAKEAGKIFKSMYPFINFLNQAIA